MILSAGASRASCRHSNGGRFTTSDPFFCSTWFGMLALVRLADTCSAVNPSFGFNVIRNESTRLSKSVPESSMVQSCVSKKSSSGYPTSRMCSLTPICNTSKMDIFELVPITMEMQPFTRRDSLTIT